MIDDGFTKRDLCPSGVVVVVSRKRKRLRNGPNVMSIVLGRFSSLALMISLCMCVVEKPCWALVAEGPLDNLPKAWHAICEKESDYSSRMARFTGYLEGAFSIVVPDWWRSKGRTPFAPVSEDKKSGVYGHYSSDKKEIGSGDTLTVGAEYDPSSIKVQRTNSSGKQTWTTKLSSLADDFFIQGPVAIDCAVVTAGDFCIVFGRIGEIRILVSVDIGTGKKTGQFTFLPAD